jgi:hypothetical protein
MDVNGATDRVTNANPPPRNPDTVSSKEAKEFKETFDRSTTSNDSSKQSQGTSNSYPIILATRPPINLARSTGNQGAPSQGAPSQAGAAPTAQGAPSTAAGAAPAAQGAPSTAAGAAPTAQGAPSTAAGAADDNTPGLEIDAQALGVQNSSPNHLPSFRSVDVSGSAVWKNKNLVWEHKFGSGNEASIGHEPQVQVGLSSHARDPSDATTPGVTRPPAVSEHPQVAVQVGVGNYTIKGKHDLEFEVDATLQADLHDPAKPQVQLSLQPGVEYHLNDKVSAVGQVSIPIATYGGDNPPPSAGIGIKVKAF